MTSEEEGWLDKYQERSKMLRDMLVETSAKCDQIQAHNEFLQKVVVMLVKERGEPDEVGTDNRV